MCYTLFISVVLYYAYKVCLNLHNLALMIPIASGYLRQERDRYLYILHLASR